MKLEFSRQIFEKYSNTKFNEIPSTGSRVVPCGRTDTQTDMTKLIVGFRNIAKAPKNRTVTGSSLLGWNWSVRRRRREDKKKWRCVKLSGHSVLAALVGPYSVVFSHTHEVQQKSPLKFREFQTTQLSALQTCQVQYLVVWVSLLPPHGTCSFNYAYI
jgi:hypothetical protein